jgi:hypothetical protein
MEKASFMLAEYRSPQQKSTMGTPNDLLEDLSLSSEGVRLIIP